MALAPENILFKNPKGFIVLEGPNGSGKSTLSAFLTNAFEKLGKTVCKTFEPGATECGKQIREIVLGQTSKEKKLTPLAEMLLFSADRNLHIEQVIKPSLARKEIVLCDRFFYSTLAFQGYGRGHSLEQIQNLTELAIGDLRPDLVLLLDIEPELGLSRTKKRASCDIASKDSFEAEELSFHKRLRDGFLKIAMESPEPFVILDAKESIETIQAKAWNIVSKLIAELS